MSSPMFGPDEKPAPISPHKATLDKLLARKVELTGRDILARAVADLIARGEHVPGKHTSPDDPLAQPLTTREHLELLAVDESIRRNVTPRGLAIRNARIAHVRWDDIATAFGIPTDAARTELLDWITGQEHLWDTLLSESGKRFGLHPDMRAETRALLADDE